MRLPVTTISLRPFTIGNAATMSASAPGWRSSSGPASPTVRSIALFDPLVVDQGSGVQQGGDGD